MDRNSSHAPDDQFAAGSKSQMSAAVTCAKLQSTSWPRPPALRPAPSKDTLTKHVITRCMRCYLSYIRYCIFSVVAVAAASPILHASFRLPKLKLTPRDCLSTCMDRTVLLPQSSKYVPFVRRVLEANWNILMKICLKATNVSEQAPS